MLDVKLCVLVVAIAVVACSETVLKSSASRNTRRKLRHDMRSFTVPDVTTCVNNQQYIVNYIRYVCLAERKSDNRSLFPAGCATKNNHKGKLLKLGTVHHTNFFTYKCVTENHVVKYKPISCRFGPIEIPPKQKVKSGKVEFSCQENESTGHMMLIEHKYLHDLCSLGHKNSSLVQQDANNCPGLTTSIFHSDYGSGSLVFYDIKKQALKPSNRGRKHKYQN